MRSDRYMWSPEWWLAVVTSFIAGANVHRVVEDNPYRTLVAVAVGLVVPLLWLFVWAARKAFFEVLEEFEHRSLVDDQEFWNQAWPHLREGRTVSGERNPDGTINITVSEPEGKQAKAD